MTSPRAPGRVGTLVLRLGALALLIIAANWGVHHIREALNLSMAPQNEQKMHRAMMAGLAAYIVLLAMPFVPGAEIGVAMLAAFGAAIAPLVYAATLVSMILAYVIGRAIPIERLTAALRLLRMRRAAALLDRAAPLSGDARLGMLLERAPSRVVALGVRNRYLALALAVNTPGNSLIGGGGGIMMMAGLSGIFAPLPTLLAIAIAVSPVPLAVLFLGLSI